MHLIKTKIFDKWNSLEDINEDKIICEWTSIMKFKLKIMKLVFISEIELQYFTKFTNLLQFNLINFISFLSNLEIL